MATGRWLKRVYEPCVGLAIRVRLAVLGCAVVATVAALWLASTFGTAFLPEFREGTFTVFVSAPPGTSLAASDRLASAIERRLLEVGVEVPTRPALAAGMRRASAPCRARMVIVAFSISRSEPRAARAINGVGVWHP